MTTLRSLRKIWSYNDASEILGNRDSRKLANNTTIERRGERTIAIRLHGTDILTYQQIGEGNETATILTFNTGGWSTPTTKQRINALSPVHIYQEKFSWFFDCKGNAYQYKDGMSITLNFYGNIAEINAPAKSEKASKKAEKLDAKIKKYVSGFLDKLIEGKIPAPSAGDCFYCAMREVKTNKPLGEASRSVDHIQSHISERYYVPSLLMRAIEFKQISPIAYQYVDCKLFDREIADYSMFDDIAREQIGKSLLAYIRFQFKSEVK